MRLLTAAVLVASTMASLSSSMRAVADSVKVEGGSISGVVDRGVRVFKGIPYAAPPVGNLRWKPPQPVGPWTGTRDGSSFGAECPQVQYPPTSIYVRPLQPQNEDCLFLNVWTTAEPGGKQPVLVWIHGGALTHGSGISDVRDGVPLARKGIVLVSLNYRLGPLGYLAHPELTAESPKHSSGNYGVLDQIAALQWVRKNIAVFGGNPSTVTIAGESAGSWSVNTLVASPLAKGLFIRAIGESGGRFTRTPHLRDDRGMPSAESVGVALAKEVGASSLAALRAVPADTLVAAAAFRTQENVDGWVLPDEIRAIFATRRQNRGLALIVGSNANEMTSLGGSALAAKSVDDFRKRMTQLYGDQSAALEAAYGVKTDADAAAATLALARDVTFTWHMRRWARATVESGSAAFLYFFSYAPPSPRAAELGAFHAGEIPDVFNVIPSQDPREARFAYTDADRTLADTMSSYWVNFVKTGDPNGHGLPEWPPYRLDTEPYLEFGRTITVGTKLLARQLDALDTALAR